MKIYVINFVKRIRSKFLAASLLILTVILSVILGTIEKTKLDDFVDANANNIPCEKIIILDAGHGGEDPGVIGANGIYEKDLNLEIALQMGKMLEEKGYIVIYTRTDDRLLYHEDENIKGIRKISDLKNRCEIASRYPESIFVSIHMNSYGSKKYSGLQVYYSEKNEGSRSLAESIQSRVTTDLQNENNRKIKSGKDIYLLENISSNCVLVECGFLTNEAECKKLSQKEYQKELSFSIVCGIIEYVERK